MGFDPVSYLMGQTRGSMHSKYTAGDGVNIDGKEISIKLDSSSTNGLIVSEDGLALPLSTTTSAGAMSAQDKQRIAALGTAAVKDVPAIGDAAVGEVVLGSDSRLTDARNAADVHAWAKADTKPAYTAIEVGAIPETSKGAAGGVAELDSGGKVPAAQLPSYVDDVLEYANLAGFPATGESGKIYVAQDTNKSYRWGSTDYVEISESLALGETSSTAYAGSKGKANADAIDAMKDGTVIDSFGDVEAELTDKQPKILDTALTIEGASKTTVESALSALNTALDTKAPLVDVQYGASTALMSASSALWNMTQTGSYITETRPALAFESIDSTIYLGHLETTQTVNGSTGYIHQELHASPNGGGSEMTTFTRDGSLLGLTRPNVLRMSDYASSVNWGAWKTKIDTAGTGLTQNGTALDHSNSVTAKSNTNLAGVSYDTEGHVTGKGTEYDVTTTISSNSTDIEIPTARAVYAAVSGASVQQPDGAGAHNCVYRGKYLGSSVTAEQYAAIAAGTFEDLYIGDYWTISSVNYRAAAFDFWYGCGDGGNYCTTHHVVIVPDSALVYAAMNSTKVTTGGYVGSNFYTGNNGNTALATAKATINSAFGSAHILKHRENLTNATTNGYASGASWYDSTAELMTEQMLYGCRVYGNSINGTAVAYNGTVGKVQLPLFAMRPDMINYDGLSHWLRDVASSENFACAFASGIAGTGYANSSRGIRPAFGIVA